MSCDTEQKVCITFCLTESCNTFVEKQGVLLFTAVSHATGHKMKFYVHYFCRVSMVWLKKLQSVGIEKRSGPKPVRPVVQAARVRISELVQ